MAYEQWDSGLNQVCARCFSPIGCKSLERYLGDFGFHQMILLKTKYVKNGMGTSGLWKPKETCRLIDNLLHKVLNLNNLSEKLRYTLQGTVSALLVYIACKWLGLWPSL